MELQLRKLSNLLPTDVLWEVSTLHYFKGKRRVSSVLVSDGGDAATLFDKAVDTLVKTETRCDVIKECVKTDRYTGELRHKTVVYSIGDRQDETVGITVRMVTVY